MSSKNRPIPDPMPSGQLQVAGDHGMPDRGTSTGVTDTYGADLSQGADNRQGSIRGATRSDSFAQELADPADSKIGG